jgi:universal stress protein E
MRGNRILTVVDPTAGEQPALARAADLSAALGVSIELFICDYDQYLGAGRLFDSGGLEKARESVIKWDLERLERMRTPLVDRGLDVAIDARWGHPLDRCIAQKALESQPQLVAKDTHYHSLLKRTILSNTDWNLIRSCPTPLLLVKPRAVAPRPVILAAVDPTHEHDKPAELDKAILAFAKELATATGGLLKVVHVYDTAPAIAAASDTLTSTISVPIQEITAGIERRHREAFARLLAEFPIDAENAHLESGAPAETLIRMADELDADYVVMGAVARGRLERVFVGSTAERVLDRLPCDLVVIKPTAFDGRGETLDAKRPETGANAKDPAGGAKDPAGGAKDPAGGAKDPAGGAKNPAGGAKNRAEPRGSADASSPHA